MRGEAHVCEQADRVSHVFVCGSSQLSLQTIHVLEHRTASIVSDLLVGWLLNVPATCECISGTDLHRQVYVLPH